MAKQSFLVGSEPVDAVVTWVDGSDPAHRAKMKPFLDSLGPGGHPGALPSRFGSVGEIHYCVLSILRFAPFVRNVFIVTDNQDPGVIDLVTKHFPEKVGAIKIVDHREIFHGYEQYLPTFNSSSIEPMLWRIPGLSKNYLFFNDDTFLVRPTFPSDFLVGDRPVLRGKWNLPPLPRIALDHIWSHTKRVVFRKKWSKPRLSFQVVQWLSAHMLGFRWRFFLASHTIHVLSREKLQQFFEANPLKLEKNITPRFREYWQFHIASLSNHLEILDGNKNFRPLQLLFFKPAGKKVDYVKKKIEKFGKNPNIKFACIQDLDVCSPLVRQLAFEWLDDIIAKNNLEKKDKAKKDHRH